MELDGRQYAMCAQIFNVLIDTIRFLNDHFSSLMRYELAFLIYNL